MVTGVDQRGFELLVTQNGLNPLGRAACVQQLRCAGVSQPTNFELAPHMLPGGLQALAKQVFFKRAVTISVIPLTLSRELR